MSASDAGKRVPSPERAAKMIDIRPYGSSKVHNSHKNSWIWTCDYCGDSGMTILLKKCSQCQHPRCTYCKIQKIAGDDKRAFSKSDQYGEPKKNSVPSVLSLRYSPKALLPSATSEQGDDILKTPAAGIRNTPLPSVELPELVVATDNGSSSSYSTPASEAIPTPTSTQESISSGPFSNLDYVDSETDVETEDTEFTEDVSDDEDTLGTFENTIDFLDSPNDGSDVVSETQGRSNVPPSNPGKEGSSKGSPRHKHGRKRDGSKDRGDKPRVKRQMKRRNRSADPRHRFACHFNKKDPARYCPRNNPIFNVCHGRGVHELRRLKKHFEEVHRQPQCNRCYTTFTDCDELKDHQQTDLRCDRRSDILKEGIDDSQWAKIVPLFIVQRNLDPCRKEEDDFDRWFKIWDILYPNISRPPNPWADIAPISPRTIPNDAESIIAAFNHVMERDFERRVIQRDELVHQRYERGIRLAIQAGAGYFEVSESPFGPLVPSETIANQLPSPYQSHLSSGFETRLVRSKSRQPDVRDGDKLQRLNESDVQIYNVREVPNAFSSIIDLTSESPAQQNMTGVALSLHQFDSVSFDLSPDKGPVASNAEPSQDFSEFSRDSEFVGGSYFNPLQEDYFMQVDNGDLEFDEYPWNSDLTAILDSDIGMWQNRQNRN